MIGAFQLTDLQCNPHMYYEFRLFYLHITSAIYCSSYGFGSSSSGGGRFARLPPVLLVALGINCFYFALLYRYVHDTAMSDSTTTHSVRHSRSHSPADRCKGMIDALEDAVDGLRSSTLALAQRHTAYASRADMIAHNILYIPLFFINAPLRFLLLPPLCCLSPTRVRMFSSFPSLLLQLQKNRHASNPLCHSLSRHHGV